MPFDIRRQKILSRRAFIVGSAKAFCFSLVAGRLFQMQVMQYKKFRKQSEGNRIRTILIVPPRGIIYDRNDISIVQNVPYQRIIFNPSKNYKNDLKVILKIGSILKANKEIIAEIIKNYKLARGREFILYKYLSREELLNIEFYLPYLPDVTIDTALLRVYNNNYVYSHVIGYLGQLSEEDMKDKTSLTSQDIRVGKRGIEKYYDSYLTGKSGFKALEVDSKGHAVTEFETKEPTPGNDLKISIDSRVQEYAHSLFEGKIGASCLIDIRAGNIISMTSSPSFDANLITKQITRQNWNSLINDPSKPFLNRAASSAYPPGSIFKLVVAIAALEKKVNPDLETHCPGYFYLGKKKFNCWKTEGHGRMNMLNAIKNSCNVYFYRLGLDLDVNYVGSVAKELSLGTIIPGLQVNSQNPGNIPTLEWKEKVYNDKWRPGDTINFSIGQGYNLINCVQIATMISRIASGKSIIPTLEFRGEVTNFANLQFNTKNLDLIKRGMFMATNTPGGTSYFSRIQEKGMEMSGKTGSAQVVSRFIKNNEKREEFENTHGLFVGFAPFEVPKYAIGIIVERGGFGSVSAAPIAKQIMKYAQELNKDNDVYE